MIMEDLSLHILDIAENSITAGAGTIAITICEDSARDLLSLEITDDGRGMEPGVAEGAADPFYTTRTTRRVGLGLALLQEAATAANGTLTIRSAPGAGTTIRATFQLGHIDRKPLGAMADTVAALIATHDGIDILYRHHRDGKSFVFDTKEIQRQTGGASLATTAALSVIREHLKGEEQTLAR
jgi:anti-sigma regulatory factor (Ser/Thr protein kinase)